MWQTLEMHGQGNFFDPRLDNATQFPVAAANKFGHVTVSGTADRVTPKLAGLHAYQLAIAAPKPAPDPFNFSAKRGETLFNGKAQCAQCHAPPLFTEPGWNAHVPGDVCVDSFQADRSPDHIYRTAPLGGLFTHQKGGFYHDGRFANLGQVINHYNGCMNLGLSADEMSDQVQYLLTL